jgi:hypothetical protein
MSLRDAITEIISQMEEDLKEVADSTTFPGISLKGHIRQLKSALKASEGEPAPAPKIVVPPEVAHRIGIEEARKEFRGKSKRLPNEDAPAALLIAEEMLEPSMAEMMGGPGNGTFAPIPPEMPVGASTKVAGAIYKLEGDRKLHYVPPVILGTG